MVDLVGIDYSRVQPCSTGRPTRGDAESIAFHQCQFWKPLSDFSIYSNLIGRWNRSCWISHRVQCIIMHRGSHYSRQHIRNISLVGARFKHLVWSIYDRGIIYMHLHVCDVTKPYYDVNFYFPFPFLISGSIWISPIPCSIHHLYGRAWIYNGSEVRIWSCRVS